MNANFGLLDELEGVSRDLLRDKVRKREAFAERGLTDMRVWRDEQQLLSTIGSATT